MRAILSLLLCLQTLTMFLSPASASAATVHLVAEAPSGFDELASAHVILVDVYFGGTKIAESLATARPGWVRFRNAAELLQKIPQVVTTPELRAAIDQELATNSDLACAQSNAKDCGVLRPQLVGIIYDADRFRVDLFVNPKFVRTSSITSSGYLPRSDSGLSLTDTIGLNASGTFAGRSSYDMQNRTIVALGNARVRADTAIASGLGLLVDDLVAEVDQKGVRYSGGLFWAPANEFIGQRRILGGGIGTQFDTWADHEAMSSTPLIVFLAEPVRIDLLVDGRLMGSRSYAAGNVEVDTGGLPEGSYPVLLRIRHPNGSVEEQRRFFVKNSHVPAKGHPIVYAYAGLLANTKPEQPVSPSGTLFYELGAARRVSNTVALDIAALGTQHKAMVEGGGWFVGGGARLRAAGLISTSGDWGALLQLGTSGRGPFTMSLDVRRIWSRNAAPLVPLASSVSTFDVAPPAGVQLALGSYTQATASIGFRLANGFLSLIGSYRKDRSLRADYTMGPSLSLPVITRSEMQIVFDASAQRSRSAAAAFAGFRVLFSSRNVSVGGTLGRASQTDRSENEPSVSRIVGSVSAQWSQQNSMGSEVDLAADVDRNIGSSTIHAEARVDGPFGNLRADILKDIEVRRPAQYNLAFQSGMAVGGKASTWGSRELEQSAIIVAANGDAADASFTILVDDVPRGQVSVGHRLTLFVPPYRTYSVRLVPSSSKNISYDTAERQVTLYPGNIKTLSWTADALVTLFGQAVSKEGTPIANALVQTAKGVAETDSRGYFQIDARSADPITISKTDGASCVLNFGRVIVKDDFSSVGKVICR